MSTELSTAELGPDNFADFRRFFSQGNGWDHCGCNAYAGIRPPREVRLWADKRDWNLDRKAELVACGRAHGVLVYAGSEPVGWCQFGDGSELLPGWDDAADWRITCFSTRPDFTGRGVASLALDAALRAIAQRGGGRVHAYPVARPYGPGEEHDQHLRQKQWEATLRRLLREFGRGSVEVEQHLKTRQLPKAFVDGVGEVQASFGHMHCGTVAMFQRVSFNAVGTLPRSTRVTTQPQRHPTRVIMERAI